jgi:hypothetical protein
VSPNKASTGKRKFNFEYMPLASLEVILVHTFSLGSGKVFSLVIVKIMKTGSNELMVLLFGQIQQ